MQSMINVAGPLQTAGTVVFFSMGSVDCERFYSSLAGKLEALQFKIIFLIDDEVASQFVASQYEQISSRGMNVRNLRALLKKRHVTHVVTHAVRPSDLRLCLAARKESAQTIYLQHGLYIPFMKRSLSFFLRNLRKAIRTLWYALDIASERRDIRIFSSICLAFIFGRQRDHLYRHRVLLPEVGFVWSRYWLSWHTEHYFFPEKSLKVVGNPDLQKFRVEESEKQSVVVIYQTLAEDGRAASADMLALWGDIFYSLSDRFRVLLKWHPRGDERTRSELNDMGYEVIDYLPICDAAIGLYSSLLAVFPILNMPVYALEMAGHPIPKAIKSFSRSGLPECEVQKVKQYEIDMARYYFGDQPRADVMVRAFME